MSHSPARPPRLFCTFRLGGRLHGVDVLDVKEVTAETAATRVAHAPDEVVGLVNIRGHVVLALDLRRLLGGPALVRTDATRLVLFKPSVGHAFGVMVDEIAEIRPVDPARIEPFDRPDGDREPPATTAAAAAAARTDLIDGVCELDDDLLVILNPRRFLAVIEQSLAPTT